MDRTRHMQAQASDAAQLPVDEDDGEGEDGGLLIAGSHHSPRRSQLLTSAIMADEDDVSQPAESQRSPEQVAKEGLQVLRHVSELTDFNVDAFFLDPLRPVKVVLFTKKPNVPSLWLQLAELQQKLASFGVIKHTEEQLLERFSLAPASLPRVIAFIPSRRIPFEGQVDLHSLSLFVQDAANSASSSASSSASTRPSDQDEWLSMDFGASSDPEDALRPRFSFRRQDGAQIMSGSNLTPVMRGFVWARKEQMLSKLESGRIYDIAQALLLQHVQNERSPFKSLVSAPILALSDALTAEIGAGVGSDRPGLKEAEALLRDGRLAYPREDASDAEALLQWNISGVSHLRASAELASPSASLLAAFDTAGAALQGIATSLPLPSAAQAVMEEVQGQLGREGGKEGGKEEGKEGGKEGGEEGKLSAVQGARLKEMVQAALLLHVLADINLDHEFGGGLGAARTEEAERAAHLLRHCKLLAGEALASSASFGEAGVKAADLVSDPASNPRLMLEHADPPIDLGLRSALSMLQVDGNVDGNVGYGWAFGAGGQANVLPIQIGAAREYQCAVFNCYMIRRAQMSAEAGRHTLLNASLSSLLSVLRHLAALALPAAFTPPSPFAPLIYSAESPR